MVGVVHVDRMRVRHVDAHVAERVAVAESCRTVKFGVRSDCQSTELRIDLVARASSTRIFMRAT